MITKEFKEWHQGTLRLEVLETLENAGKALYAIEILNSVKGFDKNQVSVCLSGLRLTGLVRRIGPRSNAKWALLKWYENGVLPEKYLSNA